MFFLKKKKIFDRIDFFFFFFFFITCRNYKKKKKMILVLAFHLGFDSFLFWVFGFSMKMFVFSNFQYFFFPFLDYKNH